MGWDEGLSIERKNNYDAIASRMINMTSEASLPRINIIWRTVGEADCLKKLIWTQADRQDMERASPGLWRVPLFTTFEAPGRKK